MCCFSVFLSHAAFKSVIVLRCFNLLTDIAKRFCCRPVLNQCDFGELSQVFKEVKFCDVLYFFGCHSLWACCYNVPYSCCLCALAIAIDVTYLLEEGAGRRLRRRTLGFGDFVGRKWSRYIPAELTASHFCKQEGRKWRDSKKGNEHRWLSQPLNDHNTSVGASSRLPLPRLLSQLWERRGFGCADSMAISAF